MFTVSSPLQEEMFYKICIFKQYSKGGDDGKEEKCCELQYTGLCTQSAVAEDETLVDACIWMFSVHGALNSVATFIFLFLVIWRHNAAIKGWRGRQWVTCCFHNLPLYSKACTRLYSLFKLVLSLMLPHAEQWHPLVPFSMCLTVGGPSSLPPAHYNCRCYGIHEANCQSMETNLPKNIAAYVLVKLGAKIWIQMLKRACGN